MSEELITYHRENLTLAGSLGVLPDVSDSPAAATALVYSPEKCSFAVWRDGALFGNDNTPLLLSSIFDARVFDASYELRWHHECGGKGRAAILTTNELVSLDWDCDRRPILSDMNNELSYLLWGKPDGETQREGWITLSSARVGKIHVPSRFDSSPDYIQLTAVEYFGVEEEHGNVQVIEQRMTGFQPAVAK